MRRRLRHSRVTANGSEILYCEYYREHSTGQKRSSHPNTTYYDMYMGNDTVFRAFRNGDAWKDRFERPKIHPTDRYY